ncbi:TonB-dependent receptor [Arenitalea sp.]|nr:TonB-dependent receptor [Algibacter sp.]MDA9069813.1 TonB-dependent receptor [Algibacter sp.]
MKLFKLFLVLTLFSVQATLANELSEKSLNSTSEDIKTIISDEVLLQKKITGTVKDEAGIPLAGVNVLVKGTNRGALTDFDGNYQITAEKGEEIVFSYVGMKTTSVTVGDSNNIDVSMEEDRSSLDEVVIVGYGSQKKSDLTGAISSLSGAGLDKLQVSDPSQLLLGRMTGVRVESVGGSPGAATNIVVRGVSSLSTSNPLFVIDGMFTDSMDFLNPSDIKSIQVLKDASAAAIYGSRAANGVVIITTNTGKGSDGLNVDFEVSTGFQSQIKKLDWLSGSEYADLRNAFTIANTPVGQTPDLLPGYNQNLDRSISTITDDIAISDAPVTNMSAKIYGTAGIVNFNISANWLDQDGIIVASDFDRKTFRTNLGLEKGKFKISQSFTVSTTYTNRNTIWNLQSMIPSIPFRNPDNDGGFGGPLELEHGFDGNNFVGKSILQDRHVTNDNLLGNLNLSYEFIEGLTANLNVGVQNTRTSNYTFTPSYFISPAINANNPDAELIDRTGNYVNLLGELTVNYKKIFDNHSMEVLGGLTSQKTTNNRAVTWVSDFPNNEIRQVSAANNVLQVGGTETVSTLRSVFGRVNYNYNEKYYLSATIRRDGSSRFAENNRFGVFPSVSAAWTISKENFLKDSNTVNNLKFRASYGELGAQNIGDYAFIPVLNINSDAVVGSGQGRVPGISQTVFANPNLVWETTKTYNFGLDASLFDYKLTLTADYFDKKSEDILVNLRIPPTSGTNTPVAQNAASIQNTGFEFAATYSERIGDFSFNLGGNITFLDNEILALGENISPIVGGTSSTQPQTLTDVGQPVASYYGYKVIGIYETEGQILADDNADPNAQPGDFIYADFDNSGALTVDDQTFLGSYTPEFEYGFTFDATYKNWDINMIFNGVNGVEIWNNNRNNNLLAITNSNLTRGALDYWTPDNTDASLPRIGGNANNSRASSFYVEDGDYFRLRNLQIGYTLPKSLTDKINLRKLRIYTSVQNVFTITKYSGYYPEVGRSFDNEQLVVDNNNLLFFAGIDQSAYPTPRTFIFGVQVGL